MIKTIIEALKASDYYGVDPLIDFAKGSHREPTNWKEIVELTKRIRYGKE